MYVRQNPDGSLDWSINDARNDTNLMDFRHRNHHALATAIQRIDDFLGHVVFGRVMIDTLGMVKQCMDLGMSRENAERIVMAARSFAMGMHESGMDAEEIRDKFEEVYGELRGEAPRSRRQRTGEAGLAPS